MTPHSAATQLPFDPQKLGNYAVLGEGVWGSVIDPGDGTVIKLARERCAEIGNGREKIDCEFKTLCALHAQGEPHASITPRPLAHGNIPGAIHPDPTLWLQTTKVAGHSLKAGELQCLDREVAATIGSSVGTALAGLHRDLERALVAKTLPTTTDSLRNAQREFGDDAQAIEFVAGIQKALNKLAEKPLTVIHGDFNISNLLFEKNQVRSITDFAETRCGFYEEDLAPVIEELPALHAPLVSAFERASGRKVSDERLLVALATFELFTFAISGRLRNVAERSGSQDRLVKLLGQLL